MGDYLAGVPIVFADVGSGDGKVLLLAQLLFPGIEVPIVHTHAHIHTHTYTHIHTDAQLYT